MRSLFTLIICLLLLTTACTKDNEANNVDDEDKSNLVYQLGETETIINDRYDFEFKATVNDYELLKQTDKYDINEKYNDFEPAFFEDAYVLFINVTIENTDDKGFHTSNSQISLKIDEEYYLPSVQQPMYLTHKVEDETEKATFYFPMGYEYIPSGEVIQTDLVYFVKIDQEAAGVKSFQLIFENGQQGETTWELPNTLE